MFVSDQTYTRNGKTYRKTFLAESYREDGKVKQRILYNLSHATESEKDAIKFALKYKNDLEFLRQFAAGTCQADKIAGCVLVLDHVMKKLGIDKILSPLGDYAPMAQWLIMERLIENGSRLSAVRLAQSHYACEILKIPTLQEDDLYKTLSILHANKEIVEKKLFRHWQKAQKRNAEESLFLYDVSSSYFEGECNELAAYGYNRDKKIGKMQVVYGLLTDSDGNPVGIEVFPGNTVDTKTVATQIDKIKSQYGCKQVTLVGDKGMIKGPQIDELAIEGYHYITTITKPQIEKLLQDKVLQIDLFDSELGEVCDFESKIRYIFRRNPQRQKEMKECRQKKIDALQKKLDTSNLYLKDHAKATTMRQLTLLEAAIKKIKLEAVIFVTEKDRVLSLIINENNLGELSKLDGTYVMKTDLALSVADKETIHSRYKALAEVEKAFRVSKSELCARPIYLRKKDRTVAHFTIVMFAYAVEKYLENAWKEIETTVSGGIEKLKSIVGLKFTLGDNTQIKIAQPNNECQELLDTLGFSLPTTLNFDPVLVVSRHKLAKLRK